MYLPIIDTFFVEIAQSAIDGACFSSDVTDQFLTMLAMENMSDYDGDGDFGTLTRIDLDDELRLMLVILDLYIVSLREGEYDIAWVSETHFANTVSHYRAGDALLGFGTDYKWWADWQVETATEADRIMAEFATAYGEWLGEDDEDDDTPEAEHPFVTEIKQAERMGEAFGPAE